MADIINIIPLNNIDKDILDFLENNLAKIFKRKIHILYRISVPQNSFDRSRNQYDADKILSYLTEKLTLKNIQDISLAILNIDIFVSALNFVFGLAINFPRICLISTARLNPLFYTRRSIGPVGKSRGTYLTKEDKKIFNERTLTEAVHEIGHTLGLDHCTSDKCVMFFSNTLLDTDKKSYNFCTNCLTSLKKVIPPI